ncbi:MAG: TetR/AcrR family transcriptional regulator [Gammaproteobacteria bacterium]|nr:TetR/AcrR family transcriptional regulator [Gammaproteobacteria bacterium]
MILRMSPLTTKQPDITRGRILEAAFQEIHRHGFQAASLARILDDTGLTKGALYHHFPDKKTLGLAVIEEVIRPAFDAMLLQPVRCSSQPLQAMREVMRARRVNLSTEEVALGCPVNNLMQEMSPLDADFRAALNRLVEDWRSTLRHGLAVAREQGQLRSGVDLDAAALFLVSSVWGCVGLAKNLQSQAAFCTCLAQLEDYLYSITTEGAG